MNPKIDCDMVNDKINDVRDELGSFLHHFNNGRTEVALEHLALAIFTLRVQETYIEQMKDEL